LYHQNYKQEITKKLQNAQLSNYNLTKVKETIDKLAVKQNREVGKKSVKGYSKELSRLADKIIDVMVADLSSETVVK
jgi:predicted nucleic acid-binding protein